MRVLIRCAGDLASGIALRLHRAGLDVVMTDLATGLAVWEDNVEIGKQETKSIFD